MSSPVLASPTWCHVCDAGPHGGHSGLPSRSCADSTVLRAPACWPMPPQHTAGRPRCLDTANTSPRAFSCGCFRGSALHPCPSREPRAVCAVVKASASWMEKLRHDMSLQVIHSPRVGIPAGSMCWRTKLFANGVAFHQQSGSGPTAAGSLLGQGHLLLLGRGAAGLSPTPLILPSLSKPSWVLTAVSSVPALPAARESPANAVTNDCNLCVMWSLMPAAGREVLPLGNAIHAKAVMCVQPLPGSRAADPSS